jgi:hypothetical protein
MSRTGHWKDGYKAQAKQKASDAKCFEVYFGTRDLLATWEQKAEPDHAEIKRLKRKLHIAKSHLKHKGLI